ncbi:GNAT family N-acetyltransferase [Thalassotalea sp. G2M2-11]|uniref:tRNA(Met) cytidine acetyltransferase TmcA n=1 Tax=Thalassotalea sp. G2M2-11 TaxID=2787627 RepID=UPI0019D21CDE|nr:GNAT family N-acetyltransferase [Thalassotalea sp. G2M2-11]
MNTSDFYHWVNDLRALLLKQQQRCLVVLYGELEWSKSLLCSLMSDFDKPSSSSAVVYGDEFSAEQTIIVDNYRHHLGCENDVVIFADRNFHPDAFAALSGTVRAGGLMIWLCPPERINQPENLFLQRFWQQIKTDQKTVTVKQSDNTLPSLTRLHEVKLTEEDSAFSDDDCLTQDQLMAVQAIEHVMHGHRKRPLVITADRGRGKSSALAIAVANILTMAEKHAQLVITITAPHADAVAIFFQQLQKSCPDGTLQRHSFCYLTHKVQFSCIDDLLRYTPESHLLLVDEAAAIPVYILSKLLTVYPRMVFASTVHGYEGAGRGFAVKFHQILASKTPQYKHLHLHQPIRWSEHDPLEQLTFNGFLLGESQNVNVTQNVADNLTCIEGVTTNEITTTQLFADEMLLQQVFGVLVKAHYQTKPSDLKLLLNNQALRIFVSFHHKRVIAVALTMLEGEVSDEQSSLVAASVKRLKNQFLPQSLFLYNHCQQAFDYRYLRIMRIAVQEQYQQRGLGQALLTYIKQYGQSHGIALLGTSFGANKQLLQFWQKSDYYIVRLGLTRDNTSGEHSALLLHPLTDEGKVLFSQAQQQFYRQFVLLLNRQFHSLEAGLVCQVIKQWPQAMLPPLTDFDRQVVEHFFAKQSVFDTCLYSLHVWLIHHIYLHNKLEVIPELLVRRILQNQSIAEIASALDFTGKKQVNEQTIVEVKQRYLT